jgi:hypothetical protein
MNKKSADRTVLIRYVFSHTHFNGLREVWRFFACTREEAVEAAQQGGWTPPRWWQWWRRADNGTIG